MTRSIQVSRRERQIAKEVDSGPRMAKRMQSMKMQKRAYSMRRWKLHLRARAPAAMGRSGGTADSGHARHTNSDQSLKTCSTLSQSKEPRELDLVE